jgi:hypothetical protein
MTIPHFSYVQRNNNQQQQHANNIIPIQYEAHRPVNLRGSNLLDLATMLHIVYCRSNITSDCATTANVQSTGTTNTKTGTQENETDASDTIEFE